VIAASLLLLAASIATFLLGVFGTGLSLIGASIGCALASAACLGLGVMRDSRRRPAVATGAMAVSSNDFQTYVAPSLPEEEEMTPVLETDFAGAEPVSVEEARDDFFGAPATQSYDDIEPEPAPALRGTARKPAARKPAAKKVTARKPAAKSTAAKSTSAKSATAKKAAPKKAAARKPAAKSSAKKAAPRKSSARRMPNNG
jgi:hypothetical protein